MLERISVGIAATWLITRGLALVKEGRDHPPAYALFLAFLGAVLFVLGVVAVVLVLLW